MFISRFNRFFDRHSRIIYICLGLIISLSFVVFVTPGSMRNMFGRGRTREGATVGVMYGKKITYKAFMHELHLVDLSHYLRTGKFMSQDSDQIAPLMQETLRRMRILHEAEKRGIATVGRGELEDLLRKIFNRDGEFDRDLYERFKQNVLYRNSMDGADLDEALRQSIIMSRLDADIQSTIYVSPGEAHDLFDQFYEEFAIKYALFRADNAKDGTPSDAEIQAYFKANREELRTSDKRRVRMVQFDPEEYLKTVSIDDKKVEAYYERLKGTTYKGKTLEQAKPQITLLLKRQKARTLAGTAAREFLKTLTAAAPENESPAALAERFAKAAAAAKKTVTDTGPFTLEGTIPKLGVFPQFQRRAYEITEKKPLSGVIYDAGRYFVACWLETIRGDVPKTLDKDIRKQIVQLILDREAKALYTEKVEPYREPLKDCETAWDLTKWHDQVLAEESPKLNAEEKEKRREAFRSTIRDYIAPYFVQRQKTARVVAFLPPSFEADVKVTEAQIKAYYEEHADTYKKEEVRARQILVKLPPNASDEDKKAKRATLEKALAEIKKGTPFEDVAAEVSEDLATKGKGGDMGFFGRGTKVAAIDKAAFSMEVGQISDILETSDALVLLKVEEKHAGKALADVRTEIKRKLIAEEADKKAMDAATTFAEEAYDEVDKAMGSGAVAADIFKKVAEKKKLTCTDTQPFTNGGVMQPFGYEPELAREAFSLTPKDPVSDPIKGKRSIFVACWLSTKAPELPKLENNPILLRRVVGRVKRDRAIRAARERAAKAYETLNKQLADGASFDKAAKGLENIEFKASDPFTRSQAPRTIPSMRTILQSLAKTAPGTLLEPTDNSNGATLVYLVSRTLPPEEKFAGERERFERQAQWSKRYAIVQDFYDRLEKNSNTTLYEPWATDIKGKKKTPR